MGEGGSLFPSHSKQLFDMFFKLLLCLVIFTLVVLSWFGNKSFIGGGEAALSTWNASRALGVYQMGWIDLGLGYPSPFWLPRLPLYAFAHLVSMLISPFAVQPLVFWILISTGGIGMYLLADYFFDSKKKQLALLAGMFYVFNLYAQSQVWARFIFAGFFAWASFPLLLFLWIKWFEIGKLKFLFLLTLISVLFSSAYAHPAFILGFWSVALLFSVLKLSARELNFQQRKNLLFRMVFGVFGWIVVNMWWIYPYVRLQDSVISNISDWKYDLASLGGVSVDSKMTDVLLLRHKFFFERLDYWGNFYKSWQAYSISILILVITLLGFIKTRVLRDYKYLALLAIIGLLICKGTNPPFGNTLFKFLFEYVPLARAFRSSYEKFGTIWLMVYSIFFAYGFGYLYQKVSRLGKSILVGVFIPLFLVVLVWPMWKNGPFSPLSRIFIPKYYEEADIYLKSLGGNGRILSLPIIPGEGVKYIWDDSDYYGLEPSDTLFSLPVVSKTVRYKYADDKYMQIYDAFVQNRSIDLLLTETNIEYLILHNELVSNYSNASSSAEVRQALKKYPAIKLLRSIGELDIYQNTNYLANSSIVVDGDLLYSYQKINPGHYLVEIKDSVEPFELILKTSFSPLWEAKIGEDVLHPHVAFDYANGWSVDKKGSFQIDLAFKIWPDIIPL